MVGSGAELLDELVLLDLETVSTYESRILRPAFRAK